MGTTSPVAPPAITAEQFAGSLLAVIEGCFLKAYRDSGWVWTIGIGHTGPDVTPGLTITREQALHLLAEDQAKLLSLVAGKPILEAAAYISFGYNCGRQTLINVLAGKDTISNPAHCTDRHGNVLPGLQSRRALEETLIALSKQLEGEIKTGEK